MAREISWEVTMTPGQATTPGGLRAASVHNCKIPSYTRMRAAPVQATEYTIRAAPSDAHGDVMRRDRRRGTTLSLPPVGCARRHCRGFRPWRAGHPLALLRGSLGPWPADGSTSRDLARRS